MVLSDAVGAEFRAPMGMITIGGLITSTLLTLVVVPVVYIVIDTASARTRSALASVIDAIGRTYRRVRHTPQGNRL